MKGHRITRQEAEKLLQNDVIGVISTQFGVRLPKSITQVIIDTKDGFVLANRAELEKEGHLFPIPDEQVAIDWASARAQGDLTCSDAIRNMLQTENPHVQETAFEFGISVAAAEKILYLRERSRWTQEKEDELIRLARSGEELPGVMRGEDS